MERRDFLRQLGLSSASLVLPRQTIARASPDERRVIEETFHLGMPSAVDFMAAIGTTISSGALHRVLVHLPTPSVVKSIAMACDAPTLIESVGPADAPFLAEPFEASILGPGFQPVSFPYQNPLTIDLSLLGVASEPVTMTIAFQIRQFPEACT